MSPHPFCYVYCIFHHANLDFLFKFLHKFYFAHRRSKAGVAVLQKYSDFTQKFIFHHTHYKLIYFRSMIPYSPESPLVPYGNVHSDRHKRGTGEKSLADICYIYLPVLLFDFLRPSSPFHFYLSLIFFFCSCHIFLCQMKNH